MPPFRRQLPFPWQIATRADKKDRREIVDLRSNPGSIAGQILCRFQLLNEYRIAICEAWTKEEEVEKGIKSRPPSFSQWLVRSGLHKQIPVNSVSPNLLSQNPTHTHASHRKIPCLKRSRLPNPPAPMPRSSPKEKGIPTASPVMMSRSRQLPLLRPRERPHPRPGHHRLQRRAEVGPARTRRSLRLLVSLWIHVEQFLCEKKSNPGCF
jgi:hypothetical protein